MRLCALLLTMVEKQMRQIPPYCARVAGKQEAIRFLSRCHCPNPFSPIYLFHFCKRRLSARLSAKRQTDWKPFGSEELQPDLLLLDLGLP